MTQAEMFLVNAIRNSKRPEETFALVIDEIIRLLEDQEQDEATHRVDLERDA